ncbi:MAG TPA: helix-turn-helix transcriptional regulator [Thermoanaerobaculia bacterium]|nr:helix-turn-helix transcriptional regulator [Thermoanaerobaculia bacterium]
MSHADSPMSYTELPPRPELAPWVAALWSFAVAPEAGVIEHVIPPTGGVSVSVGRGGEAMLAGPRTQPFAMPVAGGDAWWGFHLWPGAAPSLLGLPAGSLREAVGPARLWLDPAWCERLTAALTGGPPEAAAAERLDAALGELVPTAGPLDAAVMTVVLRIVRSRGSESVEELARGADLSPRHLRRRFRAAVGLTPKELARVRRLRATAADAVLAARPWVDVAAAGGYADQAHLVREFRELLGVTPRRFEHHARRIAHRLVE